MSDNGRNYLQHHLASCFHNDKTFVARQWLHRGFISYFVVLHSEVSCPVKFVLLLSHFLKLFMRYVDFAPCVAHQRELQRCAIHSQILQCRCVVLIKFETLALWKPLQNVFDHCYKISLRMLRKLYWYTTVVVSYSDIQPQMRGVSW